MSQFSNTPPDVDAKPGASERGSMGVIGGAYAFLLIFVVLIFFQYYPVLFGGFNSFVHPDVQTPVRMSTYLKAAGFNADSPAVKVGNPMIVSAGEISGESSQLFGSGSGSVHGTVQPGVYYPVQVTIGTKTYRIALSADKLVTDSSITKPVVKFKSDPVLTNATTRHYACSTPGPDCPAPYTHPAFVQSKLDELRNGGAIGLIRDQITTLTVPPGMVPAN